MGVKEFNAKHAFILSLIEKGNINRANEEFQRLVEIYEENKRNDLYFKLKNLHRNLENYSLIKKAYELK